MNTLKFKIIPSENSNDHQVRILIDDYDIIGDDYLGIDPPEFFKQETLFTNGKLIIGRCDCGCRGCDDIVFSTFYKDIEVVWKKSEEIQYTFPREYYEKLITYAKSDFSWENTVRHAERLINNIFQDKTLENNYRFDWSSARIKTGFITLSFSKGEDQKLFEFEWDNNNAENAESNAKLFYTKLFLE